MTRDTLQEHQDENVFLLIKETETSNLDLSGTPLTLQVVMANHTDGFATPINAVNNIIHDRFAWFKVPVVQTQLPALLAFQLRQQLPHYPQFIMNIIGNKGIVLQTVGLSLLLVIVEESKEKVVGINNLPSEEVKEEGAEKGH